MNKPHLALSATLFALAIGSHVSLATAQITERMYIDRTITVPTAVMTAVGSSLPEATALGASFLSNTYDPNLSVTEDATVSVTFLHEGAGYKNTLGYFTYTIEGTTIRILDRQLVFPNASFADPAKGWGGGLLSTGDTVTLRDAAGAVRVFHAGDRVGFFLISNGWNGSTVSEWATRTIPSESAASNTGPANGTYLTIDSLNPEFAINRDDVARHVALFRMTGTTGFLQGAEYLVMGFEDQRRTGVSDNDFNDCVFAVSASPETAIASTNILTVTSPNSDSDGDGVVGLQDFFPNDPTRAFIITTPSAGYETLAFEDLYPSVGDADYNDAVVQTQYQQVVSADGFLRRLVVTHHLIARGAGLDHALGIALHGTGALPSGSLRVERFASGASTSTTTPLVWSDAVTGDGTNWTLRYDALFPSTRAALPSDVGGVTNTLLSTLSVPPASVRLVIDFTTDVSAASIGTAPYDPFLLVDHPDGRYDVHLPGQAPFANRPAHLPSELSANSFVDQNNFPWVLFLPTDWRFPLEQQRISDASALGPYPSFDTWRSSLGVQSRDWYLTPRTASRVTNEFGLQSRSRNWQLTASQ